MIPMKKLSLVIPVHNEEARIRTMVESLQGWMCLQRLQAEVIMVLNGITDSTKEILSESYTWDMMKILELPFAAKGLAVREGLNAATGEYIVLMDADSSFHPNQVPKLLEALSGYDLVIGSRRHPQTICKGKPPRYREILGLAYNWLVRVLFGIGIRDTQSGFKAMTNVAKDIVEDVDTDGFAFDTDLIVRAYKAGLRVREIPIEYEHKAGSKVHLRHVFEALSDLLRIWLDIHKREKRVGRDELSTRKFYDSLEEGTYFKASHSRFLLRRWWRNSKDRSIVKALELKSSSTVLDVGCGDGVLATTISGSVTYVCGIELGIRAVRFANNRKNLLRLRNVDFVRGDCRALPFKDRSFNRIVCSEVLEHVRAPRRALREFLRVSRLDGVLVVTTPKANVRWALIEFIWTRVRRAIQETRHYAMSELYLMTMLLNSGFELVAMKSLLLGCLILVKARPTLSVKCHHENVSSG
jgi:ubiquinone/menaquinone biosynthesis C-methylase UbiE